MLVKVIIPNGGLASARRSESLRVARKTSQDPERVWTEEKINSRKEWARKGPNDKVPKKVEKKASCEKKQ